MKENHGNDQVPGQNKEFTIFVNSREHIVTGKEISYEAVVKLAFGGYNENMVYTVSYQRAQGNKEGFLTKGDSINFKNEMIFDVTATDKS